MADETPQAVNGGEGSDADIVDRFLDRVEDALGAYGIKRERLKLGLSMLSALANTTLQPSLTSNRRLGPGEPNWVELESVVRSKTAPDPTAMRHLMQGASAVEPMGRLETTPLLKVSTRIPLPADDEAFARTVDWTTRLMLFHDRAADAMLHLLSGTPLNPFYDRLPVAPSDDRWSASAFERAAKTLATRGLEAKATDSSVAGRVGLALAGTTSRIGLIRVERGTSQVYGPGLRTKISLPGDEFGIARLPTIVAVEASQTRHPAPIFGRWSFDEPTRIFTCHGFLPDVMRPASPVEVVSIWLLERTLSLLPELGLSVVEREKPAHHHESVPADDRQPENSGRRRGLFGRLFGR